MKKILLVLAVSICLLTDTIAQNTPQVEGIGVFKIGKSVPDDVINLAKANDTSIKSIKDVMDTFGVDPDGIYKLFPGNYMLQASSCPQTDVFLLGQYKIADMAIKNVYLTYYKGTLISIFCDSSSELTEALKLKYGPGKTTQRTKDLVCEYSLTGNKVKLKQESYYTDWSHDDIRAVETLSQRFDSHCKKMFLNYVRIESSKKSLEESECSRGQDTKVEQQDAIRKKSKLKDF